MFISFAHAFFVGVGVAVWVMCKGSLNILDIDHLSVSGMVPSFIHLSIRFVHSSFTEQNP